MDRTGHLALKVVRGKLAGQDFSPVGTSMARSKRDMAEGVGFEPTGRVNDRRFSRPLL